MTDVRGGAATVDANRVDLAQVTPREGGRCGGPRPAGRRGRGPADSGGPAPPPRCFAPRRRRGGAPPAVPGSTRRRAGRGRSPTEPRDAVPARRGPGR